MLSEELLKARIGNFTASENHRLMAGWDKPAAPKIEEMPDLQFLYDQVKPEYLDGERTFTLKRLKPLLPEQEFDTKMVAAVLDAVKGEIVPEGLKTYAEEKALEELFDLDPSLNFGNVHTRNGEERELPCMELLADQTSLNFIATGEHQAHICVDGVGCTPDGIVEDDIGMIETGAEAKCKTNLEHARLFLINNGEQLKKEAFDHFTQVQTQMLVTGAKHWYFVIYNPFAKFAWLQFKYIVVQRDDAFIKILNDRIAIAKKINATTV